MMTEEQTARISELTRISRVRPLTAEEQEERQKLRELYIAGYRESLERQLQNTSIQYPDGHKEKLKKKD